jgi:uncharacterized protein (TIGR02996 family)
MSSDLSALLAAIVADPSDDVARLVYADCLEEHGNAARAAFIRLQIEAERHHPDSNARAALEAQARALFETHWTKWWGEVCAAVGLEPAPGRYELTPSGPGVTEVPPEPREDVEPWEDDSDSRFERFGATFRRGFPESIACSGLTLDRPTIRSALPRWSHVSPLAALYMRGWPNDRTAWPDTSFLRTVTGLTFEHYVPDALERVLRTPDLANVERLVLRSGFTVSGAWTHEVPSVLATPCASRLRHLSVPVRDVQNAAELGASKELQRLESLEVEFIYSSPETRLSALARGPSFAGLQRLAVQAGLSATGMSAICQHPTWTHLRALDLSFWGRESSIYALATDDVLPDLEECRLTGLNFTPNTVADLVRAPALKRVRHLALLGGTYRDGRVLLPLVDVADPARIETFAIGVPYFPERAADALRAKFGDRVRFLPT